MSRSWRQHENHQLMARLNRDARRIVANGVAMDTLSMGMSGDYRAAICEGATIVRIGTAVFGPRPS